jgi:hypothetical protein
MNSLQKQTIEELPESPETFVQDFLKNLLLMNDVSQVDILMKKLQFLGLNFDPFGQDISTECQQVMDNLGLTNHLRNPYLATNILLQLLDKTEEHLNNIKQ